MQRAFMAAALLMCAISVFPQNPASSSRELPVRQAASRSAVEKAARALEAGDAEGALKAADEAQDLDTTNADARYLRALAAIRLGRPFPEAESDLRFALAGGAFLRYSADDAALLLAHILVHTKRYPEALALVGRPTLAADSDALYLKARALRFMGSPGEFLAAADSGLDRFPSDARMAREILTFAARAPRTEEISARVRRIEDRLGYYRYLDPELLLMLVPFRVSVSERRDTLLEYRALGRRSPRAAVAAVELGILDDSAAVAEFFSHPDLSWADLRELRSLLRDDASLAVFAGAFSRYSGSIGYDADGDGLYETRTVYRQGGIDSWSLDFDQDGVPEASLSFRENVPAEGTMVLSGQDAVFDYGEYPYLSRVRFLSPGGVREYLFAPDVLAFPIVELSMEANGAGGNGYAPQRTTAGLPGETACASAAYRVTERAAPSADSVRVTDIDRGIPVRSLVRTRDGRAGILIYRNGAPLYELADMDGDGLFESRYLYDRPDRKGSVSGKPEAPSEFEADFDLDGYFEYRENLIPPFERTWDYDGDGKVDARTSALGDGGELREFSRKFDGRLDTAIVVREGRIVRVLRSGVVIPLTSDSGGRVLWVGRKPFDFGAVLPEPGPGNRGGIRYRVVRFGDQVIAEAME